MKLSTRAIYGIRVCYIISKDKQSPLPLSTLTKKTQLSEKYLEQILCSLVKGNVLTSTRGASGGYALSRSSKEITLYDILSAVDDVFGVGCSSRECNSECCQNKDTFLDISEKINDIFRSSTLESMSYKMED